MRPTGNWPSGRRRGASKLSLPRTSTASIRRPEAKEVLELHGSIHRNYCTRCGKFFDAEYMQRAEGVPKCECGGIIKPDVVLYEEGLDMQVVSKAIPVHFQG